MEGERGAWGAGGGSEQGLGGYQWVWAWKSPRLIVPTNQRKQLLTVLKILKQTPLHDRPKNKERKKIQLVNLHVTIFAPTSPKHDYLERPFQTERAGWPRLRLS